jgi:hypothetical protein
MKNTLWIFGDSLATGYNSFVPNCLYPKETWWSHQLAEKLGMDCINTAGSGNDRFQILTKWLTNWNDVKQGDIVIYQIGFKDRYNLQPLNINALDLPYELMKDKKLENYYDGEYGFSLFNKVVLGWGKNIKIYFWNVYEDWSEYEACPNKLLSPNGNKSLWEKYLWLDESLWIFNDGREDRHFNEIGHGIIAESFYKQITNE